MFIHSTTIADMHWSFDTNRLYLDREDRETEIGRAAMAQKSEPESPSIRGDRLDLDFGKNRFRVDKKSKEPEPPQQKKLPPEPGRVPPETSVPWSEILNSSSTQKKG